MSSRAGYDGSLTGACNERQELFSLFFFRENDRCWRRMVQDGETLCQLPAEALGATVGGCNLLCSHRCTDASMNVQELAGLAAQEGLARRCE